MTGDTANCDWLEGQLDILERPYREWTGYFFELYKQRRRVLEANLPCSVVHNDANDYNILLNIKSDQLALNGFIDFGDAIYTHTVNDLAIAAAYLGMGKEDPLEVICTLIEGYHSHYSLTEKELAVLFPAIAMRLVISVVKSSIGLRDEPDNEYIQVSRQPALRLLGQLYALSPAFAEASFRTACGYMPCEKGGRFHQWCEKNKDGFANLLSVDLNKTDYHVFDLSIGSLELGNNPYFEEDELFERHLARLMADRDVEIAIGKYNEIRPLYTTDEYIVEGNNGPRWRSLHIGLDFFAQAGTPLYAPWEGRVFSVHDNAGDRNYGPTLILEHTFGEGETFYTLYGHLKATVLQQRTKGEHIEKGQLIAHIGPRPENGNWPPHLHFQILLDLLDNTHDFPGVAFPEQAKVWTSICPDPNLLIGLPSDRLQAKFQEPHALKDRRTSHLPANLSLSYRRPLTMLRAFKQYLYDHQGRRYLDMVNNVPHVGHQHPRVVEAAQRQLAVLNTNTRYLHENVIAFSERLASKFPAPLEVCFFVNSGSEANELALRLARNWKRRNDIIVSEAGYHGNTNACVEISGYKFDGPGGRGAATYIHKLPLPDTFRGRHRADDPKAATQYAAYADTIIERMTSDGRPPAALITEPILSCGGQIVPPQGYLQALYSKVRAAGGLCIADEVQVGFGRVGKHFWAFELQEVVPDIVTMGKPIGNGHPLGAVITTREIAEVFANGMEYFNTFGGNPVSCAIGLEVLSIIEEEGLQENARQIGEYLKNGLKQLQDYFPVIGDVRGEGLFLGIELVHEGRRPAAVEASYLVNRLCEHAILLSTDGPDHNVIKIKPPLCFNQQNADFFLRTFEKILKESFLQ